MSIIFYGLLCGIALGLTGGGGSILAVPLLVYAVGIPFHQAVTISLLVVGATALVGFIPRLKSGEVELSTGFILAVVGMLVAPIGSRVSLLIQDKVLMLAFASLMGVIGVWSWLQSRVVKTNVTSHSACKYLPSGKLHLTFKCQMVLVLAGMVTGFLTGLFGVGGGFLIVPALILAAKMPIKKAITTSLLIICLISAVGFVSHLKYTSINWAMAGYFILGGAIGMLGSLGIKHRINSQYLQKIFSVLLILLGLGMVIHQSVF